MKKIFFILLVLFTGSSFVYAETRDEAERMAKVQCAGMCSTSGNYQGTANYKGKKCHVWLVRQIESARAE